MRCMPRSSRMHRSRRAGRLPLPVPAAPALRRRVSTFTGADPAFVRPWILRSPRHEAVIESGSRSAAERFTSPTTDTTTDPSSCRNPPGARRRHARDPGGTVTSGEPPLPEATVSGARAACASRGACACCPPPMTASADTTTNADVATSAVASRVASASVGFARRLSRSS